MSILCMTEKPSVAEDVAKALNIPVPKYHDGYYEGNGYIITWCVGHLVALAEPEAYGYMPQKETFDNPDKTMQELPIIPDEFKYVVIKDSAKQFSVIKKLIARPDIDRIYDLGDCGNEGIVLQSLVRMQAGNGWGFDPKTGDAKKPVYRWNATSMTNEAITAAITGITDPATAQKKYFPVVRAELCKKKADWILGMTMSRAESAIYNTSITVGRVQSPTLAFVVARYLQVKNFKKHDFYTLRSRVSTEQGSFEVYWNSDSDRVLPQTSKDDEGRLTDKQVAEQKRIEITKSGNGTVSDFRCESKMQSAPQLYDSLELQSDANKKYGYAAATTLAASQALYEKYKVITYPRTDSRFLTSDMEKHLPDLIERVSTHQKFGDAARELLANGVTTGKRVIDDEKVTDHHAIIPTENIKGFDISQIESQKNCSAEVIRNVLDLVMTRFLVALSAPFKYRKSSVEISFENGIKMTASGIVPVSMGWKRYQEILNGKEESDEKDGEEKTDQRFPPLNPGDTVKVESCTVQKKATAPPKLHTEATLLKAMLNAGNTIENGSILKGKGIGTQATRAGIINDLFNKKVVTTLKKGKTNYIIPTPKGLSVIRVLPHDLYSPKITADWETKIEDIISGHSEPEDFMRDFCSFIADKLKEAKENKVSDLDFSHKAKDIIGKCPVCGQGDLYISDAVGKLKSQSDDEKHPFSFLTCSARCGLYARSDAPIFQSRMGHNCKKEQLRKLATEGCFQATCTNKRGVKYQAIFFLKKAENGYFNVEFALPNKKG